MKKIVVQKIVQKNVEFYSMVADPRLVARLRRKYTAGEKQDVQRPWIEKKVQEISEYVAGKTIVENKKSLGLIPNAPIINVKKDLKVQKEEIEVVEDGVSTIKTQYYIMFPETDSEIEKYENQLEIIDGQHRIIAFDNDYIDPNFSNDVVYEMNFSLFNNLTDNQRKEIFMVTNEKQDKVAPNLLRYIKKSLGLLIGDDGVTYDILDFINNESSSPLYQRIMFGADKIKKGYQETQLSKIFKLYGVKKFYDNYVEKQYDTESIEVFATIINNYLKAWEESSNVSFQSPASDTITKISGLRYLMYIFPEICIKLMNGRKKLSKENFLEVINIFPAALNLENIKCVFCDDNAGEPNTDMIERSLAFRGEGATTGLAKKDIQKVIAYDTNMDIGGLI